MADHPEKKEKKSGFPPFIRKGKGGEKGQNGMCPFFSFEEQRKSARERGEVALRGDHSLPHGFREEGRATGRQRPSRFLPQGWKESALRKRKKEGLSVLLA